MMKIGNRRRGRRGRPGTDAVAVWTALSLAAAGTLPAEETNSEAAPLQLQGTVTDPVGGPIPGATIVATQEQADFSVTANSDERGRFELRLAPGTYALQVGAAQFEPSVQQLDLTASRRLVVELELDRHYESIQVIESAPGELLTVPGGVADVGRTDLEAITYGSVEEVLALQPGIFARSRFGADEVQFSVRGSGLRNNFHMRGINLLINGRPYMDADGFGDFESLDLMATERIEVWKGANALRFGGNQAGGAINFVTPTGERAADLSLQAIGGSFGLAKAQIASGMAQGPFSYYASASSTDSDGYREYSAQERRRVFSNFEWALRPETRFRVDVIYADVSEELPGSLTREEFLSNPRQANADNVANRYGRDYDFIHTGFALDHVIDSRNVIAASVHGHVRDMVHPIFQILDQDSRTVGGDFAYRRSGDRLRLLLGVSPQGGGNSELRYENLGGVAGAQTADFDTEVRNLGSYGELEYDLTPRATVSLGGRWDTSRRSFEDRFLADGDRSDSRTFEAFSPKLGMIWATTGGMQVFGNVSRSYEPPLLLELTSFGDNAGFIDLEAQDTWQYELGTRGAGGNWTWEISAFDWEVDNEIVNVNIQPFPFAPFTIPSYRNAERTRHLGLEVGGGMRVGDLTWRSAYTWSRFTYRNDPDFGDNDLPGAPEHQLYSELRWDHESGLWMAPNVDLSMSPYYVDSANTTENDRFALLGLRVGYRLGDLSFVLDAANLTDELYSGSVQVDNAIGRYLEPGNGRSLFLGMRWGHE